MEVLGKQVERLASLARQGPTAKEIADQAAAAVRALSREVERVAAMAGGVTAAEESAAAAHRAIMGLNQAVTTLADQVEALGEAGDPDGEKKPKKPARRYWLTVTDPELAAAELVGLSEWVAAVYLRFPGVGLTDCWTWHETVVTELYALHQAWLEALDGDTGSGARVVDWHERHRPGVVSRVGRELTECSLDQHGPTGSRAHRPPRVPGTGLAEQVARWWAETHGATAAPPPSREMLAEERARITATRQAKY
jgi:hypothetical protein